MMQPASIVQVVTVGREGRVLALRPVPDSGAVMWPRGEADHLIERIASCAS